MKKDDKILSAAQRIFDTFDPWDLEYAGPDDIAKQIKEDPAAVINYLLDTIQDLRG